MNVFLPLRKLQTLLICLVLMTVSLSLRAADSSFLIKNLGEGPGTCQHNSEIPAVACRRRVS